MAVNNINLDELYKLVTPAFKKLLAEMFANVDDVLYDLAENSADNQEREKQLGFLQDIRKNQNAVAQFFLQYLENGLNHLAGKNEAIKEVAEIEFTADNLSLVEEDDLEQQVALETTASKTFYRITVQLNLLNQRLNHGLDRDDVDESNNPFSPQVLCEAFGEACLHLHVPIDFKLVIYKQFDRIVMGSLNPVLTEVNKTLSAQGVLPDAEVVHKSSAREGLSTQGQMLSESLDENLNQHGQGSRSNSSSSTQVSNYSPEDPLVKEIHNLIAKDGYSVLQKLLHDSSGASRISSAGVNDAQYIDKTELEDEHLLDMLGSLQQRSLKEKGGDYREKSSIAKQIGQQLVSLSEKQGTESTLSQTSSDAVTLVDKLFGFIIDDNYLSDPIKNIIVDLQVPLTKLALLDETFFSNNDHPARQLLNQLSRTGMTVSDANELQGKRAVKNITSTVEKIQQNFDKEVTVFSSVLDEFSDQVEVESKRSNLVEQRLRDVEKGKAKTEHAESVVNAMLNTLFKNALISEGIMQFVDGAWRETLMMTCLKFGGHSKQWRNDALITEKFIKSFTVAKKARLKDKKMRVPVALLDLMAKGLSRNSYSESEVERFVETLSSEYIVIAETAPEDIKRALVKVIRSRKTKVTVPVKNKKVRAKAELAEVAEGGSEGMIEDSPDGLSRPEQLEEVEEAVDNLLLGEEETVEAAEPEVDEEFVEGNPWFDMACQLPIGAWVELKQGEGKSELRCKLVANIKTLERLIFVNRAGVKVAEKTIVELAAELKEQSSKVINDNMIFDQALESVILSLRKPSA